MSARPISSRNLVTLSGVAVLVATIGLFALRPQLLDRAEYALLDWRFQLRGVLPPRADIAIVAVDARSIDALGRWPWSRSVIAELIDRLHSAGVAAIGLDFIFSEAEAPRGAEAVRLARRALVETGSGSAGNSVALDSAIAALDSAIAQHDSDERLAEAIRRSKRVVLGFFFRTGLGEEDAPQRLAQTLHNVRRAKISVARTPLRSRAPILTCTGIEINIPVIQESSRRAGFFSAQKDPDGVVRRSPLVARCEGDFYVSLALGVYEIVSGQRTFLQGDAEKLRSVRLGETLFPTDEGGRIAIDYRGPAGSFRHLSASDVIQGRVSDDLLRGATVLVGPTEVGLRDMQTTPFGPTPGVEVQANILDSLMSGVVPFRNDNLILAELGILIAIGVLLIGAVSLLGGAFGGAVFAVLLAGLFIGGCIFAFQVYGLWINMAYPLATLIGVYFALAVTRAMTVEAGSRRIRRMFSTYVPPEVVDEMTQHQESFRLGGERRDLSILFSDIRGFTALSERLGAENVANLMNIYLTAMTRLVFGSRGTLDKYLGDAIVAFWGAPLPLDDHPLRACMTALAMQEQIGDLQREYPDLPGMEKLKVGIGIHASEVVVGNLGSELRFDYTVTGDGVNLCSRLEGLSKVYGVGVLASGTLVDRLPPGFLLRELDVIRAVGKSEAVRIFEVLGRRAPEPALAALFDAYASGLAAYRKGYWDEAEEALREPASAFADPPSRVLLERIALLRKEPPANWMGVWAFETK